MKYEVGVYRTVTHCQTIYIEAETSDVAYELASQGIDSGLPDHRATGWKHRLTEYRVSYVQRDPEYRPPAGSCNDGASAVASGKDGRREVDCGSDQLPTCGP